MTDERLLAACDVLVLRALELAGKRLAGRRHRSNGHEDDTPAHLLHVRYSSTADDLARVTANAWAHLPWVVGHYATTDVDTDALAVDLQRYVERLLLMRETHEPAHLREALAVRSVASLAS